MQTCQVKLCFTMLCFACFAFLLYFCFHVLLLLCLCFVCFVFKEVQTVISRSSNRGYERNKEYSINQHSRLYISNPLHVLVVFCLLCFSVILLCVHVLFLLCLCFVCFILRGGKLWFLDSQTLMEKGIKNRLHANILDKQYKRNNSKQNEYKATQSEAEALPLIFLCISFVFHVVFPLYFYHLVICKSP